jgi:ketosteroid isomerase-like protein
LSTEQNKAVAHEFLARFTASDIQGALDIMTSDATWWIPGKPDRSPSAGLYSRSEP